MRATVHSPTATTGRASTALVACTAAILSLGLARLVLDSTESARPVPRDSGTAFCVASWVFGWARARGKKPIGAEARQPLPSASEVSERTAISSGVDALEPEDAVQRLLADDRYAILLRPLIAGQLSPRYVQLAGERLLASMCTVPEGLVDLQLGSWETCEPMRGSRDLLRRANVDAFYLDRYPVSNAQFQRFVRQDGYQQESLWKPEIWQQVAGWVDRQESPGPRYWRGGEFPSELRDHPVVGINWHEADAFARWAGKRLPTDAEWVKAAAWPIPSGNGQLIQRKYPWGDQPDLDRANLWSRGKGGTCSVAEYAEGASAGGAHQLIGNTWEWTAGAIRVLDCEGRSIPDPLLRSLRGGAFDTYFEQLVTCQFQSGDCPTARRRNIGFRCALSACDVIGHAELARLQGADPWNAAVAPCREETLA